MKTVLMATSCHRCHRGRFLVFLVEPIGDLQSPLSIMFYFTTSYKRLVEVRGSTNHSGWTAVDTSFHRGWLVCEQRVHSVAMLFFLNGAP